MTALQEQLAREDEYRKKERERYAHQMGVMPAEVGTGDVLINNIGRTQDPYINLIGGHGYTGGQPQQPTKAKTPNFAQKYGALFALLGAGFFQ